MSNNNNSVKRQDTLDENNQNDIKESHNKNIHKIRKHFFCNICYTVPIIEFIIDIAINYFCNCGEILNFTIIEALTIIFYYAIITRKNLLIIVIIVKEIYVESVSMSQMIISAILYIYLIIIFMRQMN